ncbi:hypothetical protein [Pseudopelagicola sp. nBUS_19]|uniref:family 4 glycosyl hydrolase n=1 Tax=Pseudopelagicola sp. nBUS_19 TaxID=3395316 RepID=UPI003EBE1F5A
MLKVVLVGAGSLQFGAGILGDIFQSAHLTDAEIILNDIDEVAAKRTEELSNAFIAENSLKQSVRVECLTSFGV